MNTEDFVKAWQTSRSIDEVKQRLNYAGPKQNLSNRAAYLRRLGFKLKDMKSAERDRLIKIMTALNECNWGNEK